MFSLSNLYIFLFSLLFSVRARSFFCSARTVSLSLSLSLSRSFVSDGQKRIDGKREKERVIKGDFEMTNTSCFVFPRERETREEEKKSQNFFFPRAGQKNVKKKFIFRRTRFAHVAFAHKVKEKKR